MPCSAVLSGVATVPRLVHRSVAWALPARPDIVAGRPAPRLTRSPVLSDVGLSVAVYLHRRNVSAAAQANARTVRGMMLAFGSHGHPCDATKALIVAAAARLCSALPGIHHPGRRPGPGWGYFAAMPHSWSSAAVAPRNRLVGAQPRARSLAADRLASPGPIGPLGL